MLVVKYKLQVKLEMSARRHFSPARSIHVIPSEAGD